MVARGWVCVLCLALWGLAGCSSAASAGAESADQEAREGEDLPGPSVPGQPPASEVSSGEEGAPSSVDAGPQSGPPPETVADCFADSWVTPMESGPDYDQFGPTPGSHCRGTNHQQIEGVERVVFVGDSITVGSPPTAPAESYRARLADALAEHFGLSFGADSGGNLWKIQDPFEGTSGVRDAGDFWSCAEWGARNDDLMRDNNQLVDCLPEELRARRTLVVMTSGGNDLSSLTQKMIDGASMEELRVQAEEMVALKQDAIEWLTGDPGRFPGGLFVIFANLYEFTDGTGEVESCQVSALAGFDEPVPAPAELRELVLWINEQYLRIAVETGTDMVFMLEQFCGHGFNASDPEAPCYRGPDQDNWFDLTCIHPNPTGHGEIAEMFLSVVRE